MSGVCKQTVAKLERGETVRSRASTIEGLSQGLGIPYKDLLAAQLASLSLRPILRPGSLASPAELEQRSQRRLERQREQRGVVRPGARPKAACGSKWGARGHRKRGERPCPACVVAEREYLREYRRKHPRAPRPHKPNRSPSGLYGVRQVGDSWVATVHAPNHRWSMTFRDRGLAIRVRDRRALELVGLKARLNRPDSEESRSVRAMLQEWS